MTDAIQNTVKIYIKTMSSFRAFGSGSYKMTSVKNLKGTTDFLAMSYDDRQCSVEDYEECRRRSLLEKCQCVPSELGKVQVWQIMWKCVDYFQEGQLCSPAGRDCVEISSMGNFECQAPCEGLFADVSRSETYENSQFNKIKEEYQSYRRRYIRNIQFNITANSTEFSEYGEKSNFCSEFLF